MRDEEILDGKCVLSDLFGRGNVLDISVIDEIQRLRHQSSSVYSNNLLFLFFFSII